MPSPKQLYMECIRFRSDTEHIWLKLERCLLQISTGGNTMFYYVKRINEITWNLFLRVFFALAFCATSVGQTSAYLQDYARAKNAAILIFQLIWRKSEIDPLSISGSKPVSKNFKYFICKMGNTSQ